MDDAKRLARLEELVAELESRLLVQTRALKQVVGVVLAHLDQIAPGVMLVLEPPLAELSQHPGTTGGVAGVDREEIEIILREAHKRRAILERSGKA